MMKGVLAPMLWPTVGAGGLRGGIFTPPDEGGPKAPVSFELFEVQTTPFSIVWEPFQVQTAPSSGIWEDFEVRQ